MNLKKTNNKTKQSSIH